MNRLSITNGPRAGEVIDLAGGNITIGSDAASANIVFEDVKIASVHCRIASVRGGGFGIQDLGSETGTFINAKSVGAARLSPGDRIRIGSIEFLYESDDAPAAAPAPRERLQEIIKAAEGSASHSTPKAPPAAAPNTTKISDPDLTGKTVGGYEITGILGKGGMGIVYKATQTSLHRNVALKVLSPTLARDQKFVDLFLREARAAAQLHHPNVVTIFDVGSEDGLHYYSMEVFDGGSAEQLLKKERKLSTDRSLRIARDAARALEFAESKHLLHRDVKPDNLMITAQGVAKLADLGLASPRGDAQSLRFGTPHFVAPECLKGGAVDHRSDLYSLGATLFRMLTGRTPFGGANVTEILDGVQNKEAPALRSFDSTIPESVDALVAKLLQKDPTKRHGSARELADALDELLAPPQKPASKGIFIIAAVAAVAAVGAGGYIFFKPTDTTTKPVVIRDTDEENRLREENSKKERAMREKDAELAFTKTKNENSPPLDRAAKLEQIAKDYEGTPSAAAALEEAKKIRDAEAARIENEKLKRKLIDDYKNNLENGLLTKMNNGEFAAALQLPKSIDGFDAAAQDQDTKAAIGVVPDRVLAALQLFVKEQMNRAEAERTAGKLDLAVESYKKLIASLDGLLTLAPEQLPSAKSAEIQQYKKAAGEELAKISSAVADSVRTAEKQARAAAGISLAAAFELLRMGKPAEADQKFNNIPAGPADLTETMGNARGDLQAAAAMLQKLFQASTKKALGQEPMNDPITFKPARIVSVDAAGVRLDVKGAPAGSATVVPFDKLASGAFLAQLYTRAAEKNAVDLFTLARASLAAALAYDVAPLRTYQFSMKIDGGSPPPPSLSEEAFQIAADTTKAAAAAGAPAQACEQLLQKIEAERNAAKQWRDGLDAFAQGRFADAEKALGELLKSGRTTAAFALATGGSSMTNENGSK